MQEVFKKIGQRIMIAATEACGYTPMTRVVSEAELKEIIEQVAADYNNGWIPVEERLPDDGEEVLATDGKYVYLVEYDADLDACFGEMDGIIAWQPLPEPYRKGE